MTSTRPTPDRASAFPIAPVVTFQYGDLVVRYESPDGATPLAIFPEFEEFRVSDDTPPSCTVSWTFGAIDLYQALAGLTGLFPARLFGLRPADHALHVGFGLLLVGVGYLGKMSR